MGSIIDLSFIRHPSDASKLTRNGAFIPMIDLLLYAEISCTDAVDILNRLEASESINNQIKAELVEVLQEETPHCDWDAKAN